MDTTLDKRAIQRKIRRKIADYYGRDPRIETEIIIDISITETLITMANYLESRLNEWRED